MRGGGDLRIAVAAVLVLILVLVFGYALFNQGVKAGPHLGRIYAST